jgi:hypothetical protein
MRLGSHSLAMCALYSLQTPTVSKLSLAEIPGDGRLPLYWRIANQGNSPGDAFCPPTMRSVSPTPQFLLIRLKFRCRTIEVSGWVPVTRGLDAGWITESLGQHTWTVPWFIPHVYTLNCPMVRRRLDEWYTSRAIRGHCAKFTHCNPLREQCWYLTAITKVM